MILLSMLCILGLVAHELGHVFELWRRGAVIKGFGIGTRLPHVPYACFTLKKADGSDFIITLHPVFIGASVYHDPEQYYANASDADRLAIVGGGAMGGILFGVVLIAIAYQTAGLTGYAVLSLVAAVLLYRYRSLFYAIFPLLGLITLFGVIIFLTNSLLYTDGSGLSVQAFGNLTSRIAESSVATILIMIGQFSIIWSMFSAVPSVGSDGFQAAGVYLERKYGEEWFNVGWLRAFNATMTVLNLVIVVCIILSTYHAWG